jgi:hypothetical protein
MKRWVLVLLVSLTVAAGGRSFRHDAMKVRGFEPPVGWEPRQASSYPRLLAMWETKEGGRMTLVAQKLKREATARQLAEESRGPLERQGFRAIAIADDRPSGDDGHKFVRQLYVVWGGIGYVLTMVGPIARAPQMRRDFDEAATSLSVGD